MFISAYIDSNIPIFMYLYISHACVLLMSLTKRKYIPYSKLYLHTISVQNLSIGAGSGVTFLLTLRPQTSCTTLFF